MRLALVIGGTRSGKSAHAERLALASALPVRYVATADARDPAMAERIGAHVARRPESWTTVEAGPQLADALANAGDTCVLVDGLGVWIAAAMHAGEDVRAQIEELLRAAEATAGMELIVVAEQAGEGLLPGDSVSRAWLDALGRATQELAARATRVELVVAGRALSLGGAHEVGVDGLRVHGDRAVRAGDADHAVNVIAGGPPEWLRAELEGALERDASRYPDERAAVDALAELHGREREEIVPTNGGAEALWLLPAALRPALAACVHPGFTEAEAALRAHGVPVARVLRERERDFMLDPAAVPAEADLVIVGNPASPSGTLDAAATLLALRRPGRVLVVDEAFMDLVPGEPATLVRERLEDVIVVRSVTKALSIPGLRAGYAVAAKPLAERLRAVRPPWSANALALASLTAAARRPDALAAIAERSTAEREDLECRLARIPGVRTWPSVANFCLVEVADGPAVLAALRERHMAIRAAASFPGLGAGDLRVTARAPEQNERLVAALAEATR
ncbi:MAG TPA: bifunctional adenosylcobinamide kinase/adenosylcobinamide-phosphate guanylyltransferase [Solirubrobacteraceae bacterium]|jgi:histidinol-phosphate/aromatic aminotransferase/cobyric acid decarboxylase-like protein/adenosyl cobinamide kinase/adenosyl cobinamide phosphate guanylyltransferase|nr:bifunctional adenosylcobinamide kinase/adenosylcobinamide-phosphate guanylyltransferase [Solirubrobacteraceae bacterium]